MYSSIYFFSLYLLTQNRGDGEATYNVIEVWKMNITGEGVVVAVVDDGFDPVHPDLRGNYVSNAASCKHRADYHNQN